MFLYLHVFWKNRISISKILALEKYRIWFKTNFLSHKNGSNSLKYVLNFCHTYLYFKDITWTDFCGIYEILLDLFDNKKTSFQVLKMSLPGSGGRPGRSVGPVVGRPDRSTDVHETCTKAKLAWPVDRAVDWLKSPHSRVGAVDRELWPGQPGGRPLRSTAKNLTVGRSIGRSTGRAFWSFSAANGQIFKGAINTPFEVGFW